MTATVAGRGTGGPDEGDAGMSSGMRMSLGRRLGTVNKSTRKPRVAVIFGGRSDEHGISCVTAGSVLAAIDRDQYDVVPVGISRDGRWVLEVDDPARLRLQNNVFPSVNAARAPLSLERADGTAELVVSEPAGQMGSLGEVDVVFPLLHGPWGEDGTIQGMLELAGVRYVGAGVLASAVSMDKAYMKVVLGAAGLPLMPSFTVTGRDWSRDSDGVLASAQELGYPLFVKPARAGSSYGISKVPGSDGLEDALAAAHRYDPKALVEAAAIGGREIECGVLGHPEGDPVTSVPGEIRIGGDHEFYDLEAKYLPGQQTELDIPADIPDDVAQHLRDLAARAFLAVDCEGLARVDFFVFPDGRVVINELNTMPGFTPTSMYPQLWKATGIDYPQLVDRLLQLALRRGTGLR